MGRRAGTTLDEREQRRRATRRNVGSLLLLAALAVVLAAIGYVYYRDEESSPPDPVLPTSVPGENELAHVAEALRRQDLDVNYGQRGIRSPILGEPGQPLTVEGATLYVFIYDTVTARESDYEEAQANPAAILPRGPGTPPSAQAPFVTAGSNVIVALVGGSPDVAAKVDLAIQGLN